LEHPQILWDGLGLFWPADWAGTSRIGVHHQQRTLYGIKNGNVKLGAGAGLTVVNFSSGAEGATTTHGGDIVVWTSGSGAYAGLTFNGSVIKTDTEENAVPATGPGAEEALRHNLSSVL
jgi:lipid-binding SYLF domain-containing protein